MKRLLWMGAVVSVVFPLAIVFGYALSRGWLDDPYERSNIPIQLAMAFLPFLQMMIFLIRRRRYTDEVLVSGAAVAAFVLLCWNGLLWAVPGGSGPGGGANIGFGMLLMVQWAFAYPALLLVERIARIFLRRDKERTRGRTGGS